MDDFTLSAPVSILFDSDPVTPVDEKENGFDLKFHKKNNIGNGYRGYYWKWFDSFKDYYFTPPRENLELPTSNEFEHSFRIARALYRDGYLKNIDIVEEFYAVMELIINSNK